MAEKSVRGCREGWRRDRHPRTAGLPSLCQPVPRKGPALHSQLHVSDIPGALASAFQNVGTLKRDLTGDQVQPAHFRVEAIKA